MKKLEITLQYAQTDSVELLFSIPPIITLPTMDFETTDIRESMAEVERLFALVASQQEDDKAMAEQTLRRAVELTEKNLGKDHGFTLDVTSLLGHFYREVLGDASAAEEIYQRVLADYERLCGRLDTRTLNVVALLGDVYRRQGKLDDSEKMCRRAVDGRQKLDPNGEETLVSKDALALVLTRQKKYSEAKNLYLQVIPSSRATVGSNHGTTIRAIRNLLRVYRDQFYNPPQEGPQDGIPNKLHQHRFLIEYIHLCQDMPLPDRARHLPALAKMCFRSNDHESCRISFQWHHALMEGIPVPDRPTSTRCDICQEQVSVLPRYLCRSCEDVDLCAACYESMNHQHQEERAIVGPPSCSTHSFFKIENDEPAGFSDDPMAEVWLRSLFESKQTEYWGLRATERSDLMDGSSSSSRDDDDQEVSALPPYETANHQEKRPFELRKLDQELHDLRVLQVRIGIPTMLQYSFTSEGMYQLFPPIPLEFFLRSSILTAV
jgi:hypothetical protein